MVESRCRRPRTRRIDGPTHAPPEDPELTGAAPPHHCPAPIRPRRPPADHTGRPIPLPARRTARGQTSRDRRVQERRPKTIAGFLGRDRYTVMASVGHIRDLPQGAKEAPKSVTKPRSAASASTSTTTSRRSTSSPTTRSTSSPSCKAALKDASELYLATDEDREGEAISWHLLEVLKPTVPVKRMVFHEITSEAIDEAIENWRDLDMKLVEAQEGRRILDRLVGYEVSNVAFRRIGRGTSAGRVQSVATRLVVDRERARMAFRSGDLLGPRRHVRTRGTTHGEFPATLVHARRQAPRARAATSTPTPAQLRGRRRRRAPRRRRRGRARGPTRRPAVHRRVGRDADVTSNARRRRSSRRRCSRRPAASSASARRARWHVAQGLYERGLITYMRTDSTCAVGAGDRARPAARSARSTATTTCPTQPRTYRSKVKNAQEAHEAIRPAGDRMRTADDRAAASCSAATSVASTTSSGSAPSRRRWPTPGSAGSRCGSRPRRPRVRTRCSRRRAAPSSSPGTCAPTSKAPTTPTPSSKTARRCCRRSTRASAVACRELQPVGPHHAAAGALHRGEPGEGARGARHRSAVHVRERDRDDRSASATTCGRRAPRSCPRGRRSRRCSCSSATSRTSSTTTSPPRWRRRSTRSRAARARPRSGSHSFYFGNGRRVCASSSPRSTSRTIDKAEVNAVHIGVDAEGREIIVRVWPNGAQHRARRREGADARPTSRPTSSRPRWPRSCSRRVAAGPRDLGADPETGLTVLVLTGRFGPFVQLGEQEPTGSKEKPKRASLFASMDADTVTLDEALALLSLPRVVGADADGERDHRAERALRAVPQARAPTAAASSREDQLFTVTLAEAEAIFAQPKQRRGPRGEAAARRARRAPRVRRAGARARRSLRSLRHRRHHERHACRAACEPEAVDARARRSTCCAERGRARPGQEEGDARKSTAKKAHGEEERPPRSPRRRRPRRRRRAAQERDQEGDHPDPAPGRSPTPDVRG